MFTLSLAGPGAQVKVDALLSFALLGVPRVRLAATCEGFTAVFTTSATFNLSEGASMAYTLAADKKVELAISYVDANGNPASVEGAVQWDSSNPAIAAIEPSTSTPAPGVASVVWLVPGTAVGNCQVSAKADADLGTGVREIVTLLDVTVVGGEAVSGVITPVGEAVPKA